MVASRQLANLVAEIVRAVLNYIASLNTAFRGANVIFSVTKFLEPFLPQTVAASQVRAAALGMTTVQEYASHIELTQRQNIADVAAATVETLKWVGFIVSKIIHANRCSGGRFERLYPFDAKTEVFPYNGREMYPALPAEMSCFQTGDLMTSHQILPGSYLAKDCVCRLPRLETGWLGICEHQ